MQSAVDISAEAVQLVFLNDDKTPVDFIAWLLQTVFAKSERDARHAVAQICEHGSFACGPYPAAVAKALFDECERHIREDGHPLRVVGQEAADTTDDKQDLTFAYACEALNWHFPGTPPSALVTRLRQFPLHMQADVQVAIDRLLSSSIGFFGIHEEYRDSLDFAQLLREGRNAQALAPPQYLDVDVGEAAPVRCLKNGLWLCLHGELPYAVVLARFRQYSSEPLLRIEIAVPSGEAGESFAERCFAELEKAVREARSYRGKVLSFEQDAAATDAHMRAGQETEDRARDKRFA